MYMHMFMRTSLDPCTGGGLPRRRERAGDDAQRAAAAPRQGGRLGEADREGAADVSQLLSARRAHSAVCLVAHGQSTKQKRKRKGKKVGEAGGRNRKRKKRVYPMGQAGAARVFTDPGSAALAAKHRQTHSWCETRKNATGAVECCRFRRWAIAFSEARGSAPSAICLIYLAVNIIAKINRKRKSARVNVTYPLLTVNSIHIHMRCAVHRLCKCAQCGHLV